jgi:hypothetical protein
MKMLLLMALFFVSVMVPKTASAHVFFKDTSGQRGVIMHSTPDDDPIAGSTTNFYLDVKDPALSTDKTWYRIYVTSNADGIRNPAISSITGPQTVSASYVFPSQGLYTIELVAEPKYATQSSVITFRYDMRVARGIVRSPLDAPRYAWAEAGLVASILTLLVVLLAMYNKREKIKLFTK